MWGPTGGLPASSPPFPENWRAVSGDVCGAVGRYDGSLGGYVVLASIQLAQVHQHSLNAIKYIAEISGGLVQPEVTSVSLCLCCGLLSLLAQLQLWQRGLPCASVPHLTLAQTYLEADAPEDLQATRTSAGAVCSSCLPCWQRSLSFTGISQHAGEGNYISR